VGLTFIVSLALFKEVLEVTIPPTGGQIAKRKGSPSFLKGWGCHHGRSKQTHGNSRHKTNQGWATQTILIFSWGILPPCVFRNHKNLLRLKQSTIEWTQVVEICILALITWRNQKATSDQPTQDILGGGNLQKRMSMFNPKCIHGLKIPIWCTLRMLPLEFRPMKQRIMTFVSEVFGKDLVNCKWRDPRFCIAMNPKWRWVPTIDILGLNGKSKLKL
jgi:hypothetical protein